MDNFVFISFGSDCRCASALNALSLRKCSLPFDWIVSHYDGIEKCINDDFKDFHKNISLNITKTRVIDEYGFLFPHDYPHNKITDINILNNDDNWFEEKTICENYMDFYDNVYQKYSRRIERFKTIMTSDVNIIILYKGNTENAEKILTLVKNKYNKNNIMIVCSGSGLNESNNPQIINCSVDKTQYNDVRIWDENIQKCIEKFKHLKYLD